MFIQVSKLTNERNEILLPKLANYEKKVRKQKATKIQLQKKLKETENKLAEAKSNLEELQEKYSKSAVVIALQEQANIEHCKKNERLRVQVVDKKKAVNEATKVIDDLKDLVLEKESDNTKKNKFLHEIETIHKRMLSECESLKKERDELEATVYGYLNEAQRREQLVSQLLEENNDLKGRMTRLSSPKVVIKKTPMKEFDIIQEQLKKLCENQF